MSGSAPTLFQRLTGIVGARGLLRAIRFYPPYLGAGIRVAEVDAGSTSAARWSRG